MFPPEVSCPLIHCIQTDNSKMPHHIILLNNLQEIAVTLTTKIKLTSVIWHLYVFFCLTHKSP